MADDFTQQDSSLNQDTVAYERARAQRIREENIAHEHEERRRASNRRRRIFRWLRKRPRKTVVIAVVTIVLASISVPALLVPLLSRRPENAYVSTSELQAVVRVSDLSTVDFVYNGIAMKTASVAVLDQTLANWVEFRIKYSAQVSAHFDMELITFEIDEGSKTITAMLPEPVIDTPVVNEKTLDYLPEGKAANLSEVIELCREDAAREVSEDGLIRERAYKNLEDVVKALTMPLVDGYKLQVRRTSGMTDMEAGDGA